MTGVAPTATSNHDSFALTPDSGPEVVDAKVGSGALAAKDKTVKVHYVGKFPDGKVFDSSRDKSPISFTLGAGEVIQGWDRGIVGMRVGGKRRLVIPPALGYGDKGHPAGIPPGATLIFEIELLGVE